MRLSWMKSKAVGLDRLWAEHRFITQWPITEHKTCRCSFVFVTQDQPKALVTFFEGSATPFRKRAEEFGEGKSRRPLRSNWKALVDSPRELTAVPWMMAEKVELKGLYAP